MSIEELKSKFKENHISELNSGKNYIDCNNEKKRKDIKHLLNDVNRRRFSFFLKNIKLYNNNNTKNPLNDGDYDHKGHINFEYYSF